MSVDDSAGPGSPATGAELWRALSVEDLPVALAELELSTAASTLDVHGGTRSSSKIMALVRLHAAPIGVVLLDGHRGLSLRAHAPAVWSALGAAINSHLLSDGLDQLDGPEDLAKPVGGPRPRCRHDRMAALERPPLVTVIVATRERPDSLRKCLSSVLAVDYPRFEVIVVDNDPTTTETAEMVEQCFSGRVRYLREMRRGLAAAHNRGVAEAAGEIVAFVDDDVVVDRQWLSALVEGFTATAGVGCVTGLILPAQLDTPAQLLLERHGGFGKGFDVQIFDRDSYRPADPLFPFRTGRFGSGANMAFDAALLRRLGGFDPATGAGTFARGGDDLTAFFRIVVGGPATALRGRPGRSGQTVHRPPPRALSGLPGSRPAGAPDKAGARPARRPSRWASGTPRGGAEGRDRRHRCAAQPGNLCGQQSFGDKLPDGVAPGGRAIGDRS